MLVSLGLDFRRARLEVRERFLLEDADVPRVCETLASRGARETVLTRTCNRVEAYCWWPEAENGSRPADPGREIARAWVGHDGPDAELLRQSARLRRSAEVARHLFRVAAGLESQILGDIHILGQLRRAFREAIEGRSVGPHLHRLFENALRVGKQVTRETPLMAARRSVGSEAARSAAAHWGGLAGRPCVVVGCGKSGTHAARALVEHGVEDLTVLNRTVDRARGLARELGGVRAAGLDALPEALAGAHVVIVATGAPEPVLQAAALAEARARAGTVGPALVIDVSVPRNVDARVAELEGVRLLDLDALHPEAAEIEKARRGAIPEAEARVEAGVDEFVRWLELRGARRALQPLHEILSHICRRELSHLDGASSRAERTAERIVAGVLAHPMTALRDASQRGEALAPAASGVLEALFAASGHGGCTDESSRDRGAVGRRRPTGATGATGAKGAERAEAAERATRLSPSQAGWFPLQPRSASRA